MLLINAGIKLECTCNTSAFGFFDFKSHNQRPEGPQRRRAHNACNQICNSNVLFHLLCNILLLSSS